MLTVSSGADIRRQPHLVFHPVHIKLGYLRPKSLTDRELNVGHSANPIGSEEEEYISGLNADTDLMLVWQSARVDASYREPVEVLQRGFDRVQDVLNNLPPELRWRGGLSRPQGATRSHEIQMCNLHINSLFIRSGLIQHFGTGGSRYSHKTIIR